METEANVFCQHCHAAFTEFDAEMKELLRSLTYESDQIAKEVENIKSHEKKHEDDISELKSIWAGFLSAPDETVEQSIFEERNKAQEVLEASSKALEQFKREKAQVKALESSKNERIKSLKDELLKLAKENEELDAQKNCKPAKLSSTGLIVTVDTNKAQTIAMIISNSMKTKRRVFILKDTENSENQEANENGSVEDFWSKCSSLCE